MVRQSGYPDGVTQETDCEKIARLEREIERLKAENERLRQALEEALRAAKRQAAPFWRRQPQAHPEKPGRKAGQKYGLAHRREIPEGLDEGVEVPWPARGPRCGGVVEETGVVSQYPTEIAEPRLERMECRIHPGRCRRCRQPVEGRHPRQSSTAVGSAASQVGPRAVARGPLEARLDPVLQRRTRSPAHRRLSNPIWRERDAVLTFLCCPGVDHFHGLCIVRAARVSKRTRRLSRGEDGPLPYGRGSDSLYTKCENGVEAPHWRAEQAIRPMGVTRKVWGGNRAATGAQAQSILLRILQTCRQQNRPVLPLLQRLLCSPRPRVLDLTTPRRLSR